MSGRRALGALSDTDQEAADVLLKIDDPETQWRFVRAYDSGETDADELATALRRYEELDADEKALARRGLKRSDDGGVDLLEARDCNSPCKDYYEIADDIRESDAVDESDATELSDSLEEAIDNGDLDEAEAAELADEIELLASEYDIDATEVVIRSDTEYLDEIGRGLEKLRTSDSGRIDEFFAFDAGDASAVRAMVLRAVGDDDFEAVTSERAFRFSQDVQDLSSNSNVEGVGKVVNEDLTAKDGVVNVNDNNVKGAMYELRVAEGKLVKQLDSGETLKLSYEPDVDFDELSDSDISEIAKETSIDESDIKNYL